MRLKRTVVFSLLVLLASMAATAQTQKPVAVEVEKRVEALLIKLTLEEKIVLIGGERDFYTRAVPRLGILSLRMSDGPLGVHDYGPTTAYPAGIALAASWDEQLAKRVGSAMGRDARARGVNIILAPGMNIYRSPLNGRNFEYFGEDPFLASRMAVGVIEGIQSQGVIATAKHFIANNSEYGRMDHSSDLDERTMREIYLAPFEASVKEAKVGALMDAYNLVNGTYMTENGGINREIAKKEWGFDGIIMSDWGATHDGVAAAKNGLDLEMPSAAYMNAETLLPAIKSGAVTQAEINDKVRRILRKAIEFGFFDRDQTEHGFPLYSIEGRTLALEESRSGMVLLKNQNHVLPLNKDKVKTILMLGPNVYPAVPGGGGSSETQPFNQISFLEGVSEGAGSNVRVLTVKEEVPLDDIVAGTPLTVSPGGTQGLKGEYFAGDGFTGAPLLSRTDDHVNFHWGEGSFQVGGPVDHFAARWTGYFTPKTDDDYKFYTSADDGVRLYVEDELVIDDWKPHGETLNTALRHLDAGKAHSIRLEYFENVGSATVRFGISSAATPLSEQTKNLAAKADAVILCVGFNPHTESEGSDRTFKLPGGQDALIEQAAAINKNVIVVLNAGGNVDMTGWIEQVPALLHTWYPGQEGGTALAQILFGQYSPSGKLPATFERNWEDNPVYHSYYPQKNDRHVEYREGVFVGYRGYEQSGVKPMFPFGFGLSYTTFSFSDLQIAGNINGDNLVEVSFRVKNTGTREGAEIAQVYVSDSHASVPRPPKELKGFTKVNLRSGESKLVTIRLDRRAFSFYDVKKHDWNVEPGEFGILIGDSSEEVALQGNFIVAPRRRPTKGQT